MIMRILELASCDFAVHFWARRLGVNNGRYLVVYTGGYTVPVLDFSLAWDNALIFARSTSVFIYPLVE